MNADQQVNPMQYSAMQPENHNSPVPDNTEQPTEIPKHTLYIKNLKITHDSQKLRIDLYAIFSKYGKILDILVGEKRYAYMGQGWVVFDKIEDAKNAKESIRDVKLYGRPIKVFYAKTESDIITKREGTYVERPKKSYISPSEQFHLVRQSAVQEQPAAMEQQRVQTIQATKKLMVTNIPEFVTQEMLQQLFQRFVGLERVRFISQRHLAFIDFTSVLNAGEALKNLKNYSFDENHPICITYSN